MARKKQYIEEEVIDKAMQLFWRNGYKNTSIKMLEREMNINKFSIYSSFGSKHGIFIESLKCYKEKTNAMFKKLEKATNGVEGIKEFFYESVNFCYQKGNQKGCLVTSTYNEFSESEDKLVKDQMEEFMETLKSIFIKKLKMDGTKDDETIQKQANFLLLAKHGLATATRVNNQKEIQDYIDMTFNNI
ncbi:TetR/AcrR family transcriptional regulator [Flavivirga aquimarina]|uniref:TetR/AcrR family transcriptional regulator n=1 Tax=Flavivirga aquimarina TaxID=2027862 RepID=A0ABT8WCB4_9FLAO|nr:TetR/AcrR family transcriptional regulator [Flavivirga aquimarina]MDO5970787.1 TetR/AcrR family transcriptional regulator [Flavivirga aquimarina]